MQIDLITADTGFALRWARHDLTEQRPCTIGRGGIRLDKREGDGATPAGTWPLRRVLYRPDRLASPITGLPVAMLTPTDGWCDDPAHSLYNQPVSLPFAAGHEVLWRDDHAYDVIVVLGHNDAPPIPGLGSAIFMHVAHDDGRATAGCVALAISDLLALLTDCRAGDHLSVSLP